MILWDKREEFKGTPCMYNGHCPLPLSVLSRQATPHTEKGIVGWGAEEVAQPASGSLALCGAWACHLNFSPAFFSLSKNEFTCPKKFL